MKSRASALMVFALGHFTRPIREFVQMLDSHSIATLVDIRTLPRSKRNPQFDGNALRDTLREAGIMYIQMKGLGGLRQPMKGSLVNSGWRNDGFRGYADYMQTQAFEEALEELIELLRERRGESAGGGDGEEDVAVMCAEGNPFRYHRSLLADALEARGVRVVHISGPGKGRRHRMTPLARVAGNHVTYPRCPRSGEGSRGLAEDFL